MAQEIFPHVYSGFSRFFMALAKAFHLGKKSDVGVHTEFSRWVRGK
ncbi:hypothetical protein [Bartonella taylorii]|nr:hypothetical protein [Bartonella taylorii]